jgi:hypothetical protein
MEEKNKSEVKRKGKSEGAGGEVKDRGERRVKEELGRVKEERGRVKEEPGRVKDLGFLVSAVGKRRCCCCRRCRRRCCCCCLRRFADFFFFVFAGFVFCLLLPSFTSDDDDDGCLYFFRKCLSGIFLCRSNEFSLLCYYYYYEVYCLSLSPSKLLELLQELLFFARVSFFLFSFFPCVL